MYNTITILALTAVLLSASVQGGRRAGPPGGPRMRCPDGSMGTRGCNGWDINACQPQRIFYCYAPLDYGVCCRRQQIPDRCPPPSRRACLPSESQRPCTNNRDCQYGQICCSGQPCGQICVDPIGRRPIG